MTITAKVIADSVSPDGIRLITQQWRYPKFIHGEVMTHRVFSRNASSSRAIPVERMIQDVLDDPAMPVYWGANRPGMQAREELTGAARENAIDAWLLARNAAVNHARHLHRIGVHKQLVNRVIEPWAHINVVVTSTEWANFYALRRHADAQPEMHALADAAWEAMMRSAPTLLKHGEWHLPYVTDEDRSEHRAYVAFDAPPGSASMMDTRRLIKLSVARCARVSYMTHDGRVPNADEDLKLYERLLHSVPLHASPAEHQATPDVMMRAMHGGHFDLTDRWERPSQHGNLVGWKQYRKLLLNEFVSDR